MSPHEWIVLGSLITPLVLALCFRSIPFDLFFLAGALSTSVLGLVSSKELFAALVNTTTLSLMALFVITRLLRSKRPLPWYWLTLAVSGFIYLSALENSSLIPEFFRVYFSLAICLCASCSLLFSFFIQKKT